MDKQQLIDYLNARYEALEFWEALRKVIPSEEKIASLNREVKEAHEKLMKIRNK